jgi:hypothetical protein
MTKFEKLQIQAQKAIDFLSDHPAITPVFDVFQALKFSINPVCKRGYLENSKSGITIYFSSKYARRFKKEFEEEFKTYTEKELNDCKSLVSIEVPYKKLFGEEWKFDHVEYWAEMTFFKFIGQLYLSKAFIREIKGTADKNQLNWEPIQALKVIRATRTFEEMVVKVERQFKKLYGDFSCEDFLTKKEVKNHKKELAMITVVENKNGIRISKLISNHKYLKVDFGEFNQRWWKWFEKQKASKEFRS